MPYVMDLQKVYIYDKDTDYQYTLCIDEDADGNVYSIYITGGMFGETKVYYGYHYDSKKDHLNSELLENLEENKQFIIELIFSMIKQEPLYFPMASTIIKIKNYTISGKAKN